MYWFGCYCYKRYNFNDRIMFAFIKDPIALSTCNIFYHEVSLQASQNSLIIVYDHDWPLLNIQIEFLINCVIVLLLNVFSK